MGNHPGLPGPDYPGSAPHWKFRGCRVHSFPSPQELLRPASWLALLSRTFTFELVPTRSPSISVEYDYVDKQSIPTAGIFTGESNGIMGCRTPDFTCEWTIRTLVEISEESQLVTYQICVVSHHYANSTSLSGSSAQACNPTQPH